MLSYGEISDIVSNITYKPGWEVRVWPGDKAGMRDGGPWYPRPYLQLEVHETAEAATCPFTGNVAPWRSGKRYLSPHMCKQEVVGSVLGLIKDAEMHELHEWFKYKGKSIYCPHLDPDVLAEVAVLKNMDMRENAMSMEEHNDQSASSNG